MKNINIMLVGVGGQGTLLASRILGTVALKKSYDVKVSEVHGMSQRGGSVVTYVRMGEKIYSPLIEKKEADFVLAFEQLEAYRWLEYLKNGGTMIVNEQKIDPMPVIIGKSRYPDEIISKLKKVNKETVSLNALALAKKSGNIKAVNVVLLGVLAKLTGIEKETWMDAINETVPAKFLEINVKAFEEGYNFKIN